jgi:hypothetical protein
VKTYLQNLFVLLSLTGLAGCGAGGSNTSLEVSRAFATTNTSFGGGLIISGKNLTTGRFFSQGLTTSKDFRTTLEKGKWKISAVGWDGGGTPGTEKLFAGIPYCGSVEADLASDQESVTLNINQANCNTNEFTAGRVDGSGNLREFGAIITCNTFLNPTVGPASTGAISSHYIAPGTGTDMFCANAAPDLQTKVRATKIYAMNKLPGQATESMGFNSGCMRGLASPNESVIFPTNASNPYTGGYTLKLPFNNVPYTIVTYEDVTCTKPLAIYPFKNGLMAGHPEAFDHLVLDRGSLDSKLILPGNDMRRAKSALVNLMPYLKRYNSASPEKFNTVPSTGYTSLTYPAFNGVTTTVTIEESDCGDSFGHSGNISSATCVDVGDKVEVTYTGSGTGAADFTFYVNPGPSARRTVYLNVAEGANAPILHKSHKEIIKLMGESGTDSNETFFSQDDDHDEKRYGILSTARQMLSAHGAGGLLGIPDDTLTFAQACNALSGEKAMTIYNHEKLQYETFRVNIHNTTVSSPTSYICKTSTLSASDCSSGAGGIPYNKRMLIYDYKQSAIAPAIVMEFSCSGLVGRLESNSFETKSLERFSSKRVVSWNTQTDSNLAYQRAEFLEWNRMEKYVSSAWQLKVDERRMARIQKNGTDDYDAWVYRFGSAYNGSTYSQNTERFFFKTESASKLCYLNESTTPTAQSAFNYILVNSDPLLDDDILGGETATNAFYPANSFPQTPTTCGSTFIGLPSGNNADLVDGSLEFQLGEFGGVNFPAKFGGSFFTSP